MKGTIHEFEQWFGTFLEYEFTGLNTSAKAAYDLYEDDDPQGLLALALKDDDTISGSAYADVLHGFDGKDKVSGGQDDDVVHGDSGDDRLVGNRGNDTLYGGADVDHLIGSGGNDNLWGGAGGDLFIFAVAASGETDTIHDWESGDRIRLAGDVVEFEIDDDGVDTFITYGNGNVIKVLDTLEGDIVFG